MTEKNLSRLAAASALCATLAGLAPQAFAQPVASTEYGKVVGVKAEGMKEFLGIRYAAPPTGASRWQPPQPVPANLVTTKATAFGPHCPQVASPYGVASVTEDCLYLNVYVPQKHRAAPLAVMFWIHGGALVVGESDLYDPARLVTQGDVIVVTINYRLGYLGYFATPGLDAEGHAAANYGLMDQQAALDWAARNIAGFGGDPDRVTVFGESAGGLSTLSNLVSPTAHGLFSGAIVESGGYALKLPTLAKEETSDSVVAAALGCGPDETQCLRTLTVDQILAQQQSPSFGRTTIVDGALLPLSIDAALREGRFNRVPLMNGSNHDEYRLFLAPNAGLTTAQYPAALDAQYGLTLGAKLATVYPASKYVLPVLALAAVLTDDVFACPAQLVDRYAAAYVPTYAYEFNDRRAPEDFLPPSGYPFGAAHASEIQFLFDIPKLPGTPALTASEQALAASMVQYWTRFAKSASPDEEGEATWLPYAPREGAIQSLASPMPAPELSFTSDHHCHLWDPIIEPSGK